MTFNQAFHNLLIDNNDNFFHKGKLKIHVLDDKCIPASFEYVVRENCYSDDLREKSIAYFENKCYENGYAKDCVTKLTYIS